MTRNSVPSWPWPRAEPRTVLGARLTWRWLLRLVRPAQQLIAAGSNHIALTAPTRRDEPTTA